MQDLGKSILGLGILLMVIGAVVLLAGRFGLHRLPGDLVIRRGNFTLSFPIVSCIVISVVLTIVLNLLVRRR